MRDALKCKYNMAEEEEELRNFVLRLPSDIEQARRSTFSSNLHSLEHWHIRMQNSVNLLNLLCERSQNYLQLHNNLEQLGREAQAVHRNIETLLLVTPNLNNTVETASVNEYSDSCGSGRPRKSVTKEDIEKEFSIFS